MSRTEPLQTVERGPADARASIVWLHGLGADGHDFVPIVPELRLPDVRFVFPHAAHRPVTINGGMVMRAWYDIRSLDLDQRSQDVDGIEASAAQVAQLLEREEQRGVAAERTVLAGFSQGGALAIWVAHRFPRRLAGLVGLSSYLLPGALDGAGTQTANRQVPCFVAHGTYDPMVPAAAGNRLADELGRHGHPVEWRTYPAPHGVHPAEIDDVGRWLRERLRG